MTELFDEQNETTLKQFAADAGITLTAASRFVRLHGVKTRHARRVQHWTQIVRVTALSKADADRLLAERRQSTDGRIRRGKVQP